MERILRGAERFSPGGFTKSRIAWRLWASAERETSAQTGRPLTDWLFGAAVFFADMRSSREVGEIPFYGIRLRAPELRETSGEKDNSGNALGWPARQQASVLKRKILKSGAGSHGVSSMTRARRTYTA